MWTSKQRQSVNTDDMLNQLGRERMKIAVGKMYPH